MNPEAVQWLESLTSEEHAKYFAPAITPTSRADDMFTLKSDHEADDYGVPCGECRRDRVAGTLVVIG